MLRWVVETAVEVSTPASEGCQNGTPCIATFSACEEQDGGGGGLDYTCNGDGIGTSSCVVWRPTKFESCTNMSYVKTATDAGGK